MTLNDFLKVFNDSGCTKISVEGYCNKVCYDYIFAPRINGRINKQELRTSKNTGYIPRCLEAEVWFKEAKRKKISRWSVNNGSVWESPEMPEVVICLEREGEAR